VFPLREIWRGVRDRRPHPQIPTPVFPAVFFAMFLCRIGSFNELEQQRGRSAWRRWPGRCDLPSAENSASDSERLDADPLRACLGRMYSRLKGNKVLGPRQWWGLAAVDGHQIGSSYKRCGDWCLRRRIGGGDTAKVQYHHPNTILVLWLTLFTAHAVFHCFRDRNLQPALRNC